MENKNKMDRKMKPKEWAVFSFLMGLSFFTGEISIKKIKKEDQKELYEFLNETLELAEKRFPTISETVHKHWKNVIEATHKEMDAKMALNLLSPENKNEVLP